MTTIRKKNLGRNGWKGRETQIFRKLIFFPTTPRVFCLDLQVSRRLRVAVCCRLRLYFEKASTIARGGKWERAPDLFERRYLFLFSLSSSFSFATHSFSSLRHLLTFSLSLSFWPKFNPIQNMLGFRSSRTTSLLSWNNSETSGWLCFPLWLIYHLVLRHSLFMLMHLSKAISVFRRCRLFLQWMLFQSLYISEFCFPF